MYSILQYSTVCLLLVATVARTRLASLPGLYLLRRAFFKLVSCIILDSRLPTEFWWHVFYIFVFELYYRYYIIF